MSGRASSAEIAKICGRPPSAGRAGAGGLGNAAHSVAASVGFTPLPSPWTVEETQPCFIVRDANGRPLAFVYCEDEPGRPSSQNLGIIGDRGRFSPQVD